MSEFAQCGVAYVGQCVGVALFIPAIWLGINGRRHRFLRAQVAAISAMATLVLVGSAIRFAEMS